VSQNEITVQGTLNADGTLQLDEKPNLPPGRVTVVLRQETAPQTKEGWWPYMQAMRKRLEEAGHHFLDEKEMEDYIAWMRGDDDRLDEVLRQTESQEEKPEGS
jgi:hypothetical protein